LGTVDAETKTKNPALTTAKKLGWGKNNIDTTLQHYNI
jgi:hypothetical protein